MDADVEARVENIMDKWENEKKAVTVREIAEPMVGGRKILGMASSSNYRSFQNLSSSIKLNNSSRCSGL